MSSSIKDIHFRPDVGANSFFEVKELTDLLNLKPTDHSQFKNHRLTFFAMLFITEGHGTHSVNFVDYPYEPGSVFTIGAGSVHRFHETTAKGFLFIFTEDFILQHLNKENSARVFQLFNEQLNAPKEQLEQEEFNQVMQYTQAIRRECSNAQDDFSSAMIRNLLQVIFTQLLRSKAQQEELPKQSKYLSQFLQFQQLVEQHAETSKNVSFYADQMFITTRTLNNITQSVVQKSAKSVLNDLVISMIKRSLINSSININEIAYNTGFHDASHLSKFFRNHTGVTPKKFREQFS